MFFLTIVKNFLLFFQKKFFGLIIKIKLKCSKAYDIVVDEEILDNLWKSDNISCYVQEKRKKIETIDLSLIIPMYNSENFADTCLTSLLNQKTNFSYEIIVVNDGSTDKTLAIIKNYEKKYPDKIKVFNQENGGISVARNKGLDNVTGKYVGFIDHDDYVADNYIDDLLTLAYENDADIVKCGYADTCDGKIIAKTSRRDCVINGNMDEEILNYRGFIWGAIYKYSLLDNIKFPEHYWYEDMITRTLLFRSSKIFVNTSKILYYKQSHANNVSKKTWSSKNYKCLEQLYLVEGLVKDNDLLHLNNDFYFYLSVLIECSTIMVQRISGIDENAKFQVFLRVHNLLSSLYKDEYAKLLTGEWKLKSDIILGLKYDLWKLEKNL